MGTTAAENDNELLLKIAWLYYVQGMTQGQIAHRVALSRPTIVRMLQQAREEGLVEIRITRPLPHTTELATRLEQLFGACGLREALVIDPLDADPKYVTAQAAAAYLRRVLRPEHVLGVGWSTTLSRIPTFFTPSQYAPACIVQLTGSVGPLSGANSYEIAIQLGTLLEVPVEHMPAPAVVHNAEVRTALLHDRVISRTMEWAARCNIGLVGIGDASAQSTMISTGYLSAADLDDIRAQGGVGDILSHYFSIDGLEVRTWWSDRIMAIDLEQLRRIDNVVGVACGEAKGPSVLGALRGGYLNTLVTDVALAGAVLELAGTL